MMYLLQNIIKDLPEINSRIHDSDHYALNSVHVRRDGSFFPVHINSYEETVNARRLRVIFVWDITESELKERELSQHRESLEELVKFRTDELERTNEQLRSEIIRKEATKTN